MKFKECRKCGAILFGGDTQCPRCNTQRSHHDFFPVENTKHTPDLFDIMLNPKKYGYSVCPNCNGYGSSLNESAQRCSRCAGSGLIEERIAEKLNAIRKARGY